MTFDQDTLPARVERFLAEAEDDPAEDPEVLRQALDAAITQQPDRALWYTLRARLYAACYYLVEAASDWARAVALDPDDRDAALALASLRFGRADRLANLVVSASAADEESDDEEDDEEDDEQVQALAQHYRTESSATLQRLMRVHAADLDFVLRLLDAVDEIPMASPWLKYTLILRALASHPHSLALRKREAVFLADFAATAGGSTEKAPSGSFDTPIGQRWHALTLAKALRAIDAVLADEPDAELATKKAGMLTAIERYADAAAAHRLAAQLFERAADHADDNDAADDLRERAARAREQASLCEQGRGAVVADYYEQIDKAMDQLDTLRARHRRDESEEEQSEEEQEDLRAQLGAARAAATASTVPDEQERAELVRIAENIATKTVGLIHFDPIELFPIAESELVGGLSPWYGEITGALRDADFRFLAQFDNPQNNRSLGQQCQGQLWVDGDASSAFVAETVKSIRICRLVSELSDGTVVITSDSLGATFYYSGPNIVTFPVVKKTPLTEMLALHQALVAHTVAARPGVDSVPIDSLPRLAQVENRARELRIAFRMAEGLTEMEVRGMNVRFHDAFHALVAPLVREKLAALGRATADR